MDNRGVLMSKKKSALELIPDKYFIEGVSGSDTLPKNISAIERCLKSNDFRVEREDVNTLKEGVKYLILPKDLEDHIHFFDKEELISFLQKKRCGAKWLIHTINSMGEKKIFIDIKD